MKEKRILPTTIQEITVKDYMMFRNLVKLYGEDDGKLQLEIIKYFTGGLDLPVTVGTAFVENLLAQMFKDPLFIQTFKYDGILYGFIPNFDDITTGEFIDIETYQTDENSIHKLLSILYRPIDGKIYKNGNYKIKPYEGTKNSDVFLNVSVELYLGCMVFFYTLETELEQLLPIYSKNKMKLKKKKIQ